MTHYTVHWHDPGTHESGGGHEALDEDRSAHAVKLGQQEYSHRQYYRLQCQPAGYPEAPRPRHTKVALAAAAILTLVGWAAFVWWLFGS